MKNLIASAVLPGLETRWTEELKLNGVKDSTFIVSMLFSGSPNLMIVSEKMSLLTGKKSSECLEILSRIAKRIVQKNINSSAEIVKTTDLEEVGNIVEPVTTPMGQMERTAANATFTDESFEAAVIEPALDGEDPYVEKRSSVIDSSKIPVKSSSQGITEWYGKLHDLAASVFEKMLAELNKENFDEKFKQNSAQYVLFEALSEAYSDGFKEALKKDEE